jgi:micrococcal nuclease
MQSRNSKRWLSLLAIMWLPAFTVTDGDTVREAGTSYRIVGLNTPELHAQCPAEQALARAAKARLMELAPNSTLVPVPCECPPGTAGTYRCNYGRACAKLLVGGQPYGYVRDWADIAISEGLAEPYICRNGHCPRRKDWCAGH